MLALMEGIEGRQIEDHRPWPRLVVSDSVWRFITGQLVAGSRTLLGLWGDAGAVHMAVLDEQTGEILVATTECPHGKFPSVGALHPPAVRLERALRDLYGFEALGLRDTRT